MKSIILIAFVLLGTPACLGQTKSRAANPDSVETARTFRLLARYEGDSVTLRWFASDPLTWQMTNAVGYVVVRYTLDRMTNRLTDSVTLTPRPLKPLTAIDWQTRFAPTDTVARAFARLAADEPPSSTNTLGEAMHRKQQADQRFAFTMLYGTLYPTYMPYLALRFSDRTVVKNRAYIYQLRPGPGKLPWPVQPASLVVSTEKPTQRPAMPNVLTKPGDRLVQFSWDRQLGNYWFMAYYYERSADGGKTFTRVRQRPYLDGNRDSTNIILTDTLPRNYVRYQYRIMGITAFGDGGQPSPVLTVMGRDLTPPTAPDGLKAVNTAGSAVQLTWSKRISEGDLAGFIVSKSTEQAGPFVPLNQKLLAPNTRQFTDPLGSQYAKNFYIVSAVDTAGNATASLAAYAPMRDQSAPDKPTGLHGSIDSTGVFHLSWDKNKEPDLMGYLVYTANAPDHDFTPLTPNFLTSESFTDTTSLRTLTKYLYLKVVAFDKSRRGSPASDILALKRPDIVPPTSPVFNGFSVADSSATLRWVPSSSEDVMAQILYRQEDGRDSQPVELARFDTKQITYTDKTVLPRHEYAYTLVAIDDSKLRSEPSFPQRVRPYFSGVRPAIRQVSVTLNPDKTQAMLRWNYQATADCRILVYRKVNQEGLVLLENLPGTQQQFTDPVRGNGQYQYAIKAVYQDGQGTLLSAYSTVTVTR